MQHTILVVDDEKDIVDSLERQFRRHYRVFKATTGIDALQILQKEPVQLIISDQRMPQMTGIQLLARSQKIQPNAIRILLTGYTDVASIIDAINSGQVYRYVTKPWDPTDLEVTVQKGLETYELRSELHRKNEELQRALNELKTLDQAKSRFMLLIGHELKTPLTSIMSFADLLAEEKISADATKYVNRIHQGARRLHNIVFDVLDVMDAETQQMPVKNVSVNLGAIIEDAIQKIEPNASAKKVAIQADAQVRAVADAGIVSKVLSKMLHNAVKFSDENAVVTVSAKEENGCVRVAVTNNGPAIPADRIARILKPFELDENIMHHSQGLGLGLSVCQSLLKRQQSQLTIESSGKKTTISFDLPK